MSILSFARTNDLTDEILEYANRNSPMFMLALRGIKSEFYQFKYLKRLSSLGKIQGLIGNNDNGQPDFCYYYKGFHIKHEHKSSSKKYANGDGVLQTIFARQNKAGIHTRYWERGYCDIVSVDRTPEVNCPVKSFLYVSSHHLKDHKKYEGKISSNHRIDVDKDKKWKHNLFEAIEDNIRWRIKNQTEVPQLLAS